MSTSVGSLYATLSLEDREYQDALKRAPGIASQTASKINDAFARTPAIDRAAKSVMGLSDDLKLQANALGLSVRSWDAFAVAGKASDVSGQQLIRTFAGLRGMLDLARNGNQPVIDSFRELGLRWNWLARAKPDAALQQVARATFLAAEGSAAYNAGLRILNADTSPKFQTFLRRLAGTDLPALGAAAKNASGSISGSLAPALGAFLRFAAPAAIIGTFSRLATESLRLASDLKSSASAAGTTIERFQVLDYVARQNNASGSDFVGVLAKLRTRLADAAGGSAAAQSDFEALGLRWQDLMKLSPDEILYAVARAMRTAGDGTGTFAVGADLLGVKSLPRLQAALRDIADRGFPALDEAAKKSGQILSTDATQRLDEAKQAIENLHRSVTNFLGERLATIQLVSSGELDKISAAQKAFDRLAITKESVAAAGTIGAAFGGASVSTAQIEFARAVAAENSKLTGTLISSAIEALHAYAADLDKRKELTAAAQAEISALSQKLADKQSELEKKGVAETAAADAAKVASAKASADQKIAIEKSTAERVAAILAQGTKDRAFEALDTAGKIKALEADIAAARDAAAGATRTPDERARAAEQVNALEKERLDLMASQTEESRRAADALKQQAQSLIESLDPQARFASVAAHINELFAAGLLTLEQQRAALAAASADLADALGRISSAGSSSSSSAGESSIQRLPNSVAPLPPVSAFGPSVDAGRRVGPYPTSIPPLITDFPKKRDGSTDLDAAVAQGLLPASTVALIRAASVSTLNGPGYQNGGAYAFAIAASYEAWKNSLPINPDPYGVLLSPDVTSPGVRAAFMGDGSIPGLDPATAPKLAANASMGGPASPFSRGSGSGTGAGNSSAQSLIGAVNELVGSIKNVASRLTSS